MGTVLLLHGGLFIFLNVTVERHQVLKEWGDLLNCSIWKDSSGQDFLAFNFVTNGSFTADGGLL